MDPSSKVSNLAFGGDLRKLQFAPEPKSPLQSASFTRWDQVDGASHLSRQCGRFFVEAALELT